MRPPEDRDRFTVIFHALSPRVYSYARRHGDAATAEDVVSDTFLIAWKRYDDLPAEPLPWLLVVARNILSERRRRVRRQDRLADTVARLESFVGHAGAADDAVIERATLVSALAELTELEREALLLVAWEGLSNADAASVAGCSQRAFEVRLSRARARLSRQLATPSNPVPTHPRGVCSAQPGKATT